MANVGSRPLSPHLQVYRMLPSMVMSGLHRITGLCLVIGTLLLTWWLVAAALGPQQFATISWLLGTIIGKLALLGWTFSLIYHMCNGVRHMFWDMGVAMDIAGIIKGGWIMAICAAALTALVYADGLIHLMGR